MKSKFNQKSFASVFKSLNKNEKVEFVSLGIIYNKVYSSNNSPEKTEEAYQKFKNCTLKLQTKYNVNFLESPDDNYYMALINLSQFLKNAYEKTNNTISQPKSSIERVQFYSINDANEWLAKNRNIFNVDVSFQTGTRMGLFANHSTLEKIDITYTLNASQENPYVYGIAEIEKTNLFKKGNRKRVKEDFERDYPGYEYVSSTVTSNSRGSSSSVVFGFGLDYIEHQTRYILYRYRV